MERVISQIIKMLENLNVRLNNLEFVSVTYHEYKKDKEKFTKFLHEKAEKLNKDRASSSVHNDKQQKVSKSVSSDNSPKWNRRR